MGADANRAAAADRSPPTAKRGRLSERAWTDILRGARLARAEGVELLMHGVKITGTRKPSPVKMASCKGLQQPVEPAVPKPLWPRPMMHRRRHSASAKSAARDVCRYSSRRSVLRSLLPGMEAQPLASLQIDTSRSTRGKAGTQHLRVRNCVQCCGAPGRDTVLSTAALCSATHRCESSMCTDRRLDYTRRRSRSIRARAAAPWPRGLAMQRQWRKTLSAASSRPRRDSVASGRRSRAWAERAWGG